MLKNLMRGVYSFSERLRRERLPDLGASDLELIADDRPMLETDLETCLKAIKAHSESRRAHTGPDPALFFLALQQAEKFGLECLEFGEVKTHNVKMTRLDRAFTIWARSQRFNAVDEKTFAEAMLSILTWHGGFRSNHYGVPSYMGCRLKPEAVDAIANSTAGREDSRPGATKLIDVRPAS